MVWAYFVTGIPIAIRREVVFFAGDGSGSDTQLTSVRDWQSLAAGDQICWTINWLVYGEVSGSWKHSAWHVWIDATPMVFVNDVPRFCISGSGGD